MLYTTPDFRFITYWILHGIYRHYLGSLSGLSYFIIILRESFHRDKANGSVKMKVEQPLGQLALMKPGILRAKVKPIATIDNVGITIVNHPFRNGLYQLYMVIWGMVYYCYTHSTYSQNATWWVILDLNSRSHIALVI